MGAEASETWTALLEELSSRSAMHRYSPWTDDAPKNSLPSAVEQARFALPSRLFGGAGIVKGLTEHWSAMNSWNKQELEAKLSDHHFRKYRFNYPNYIHTVNDEDEYQGETLAQYLNRSDGESGFFI